MPVYEYKVIPAPAKGTKSKGLKTPESRFAHTVESLLNTMGAEGWEFQRAELLPSEERSGLTGSATNWRNLLVFRRALAKADAADSAGVAETGLPMVSGASALSVAANSDSATAARPITSAAPSGGKTPPIVASRNTPPATHPVAMSEDNDDTDAAEERMTGIEKAMRQNAGEDSKD